MQLEEEKKAAEVEAAKEKVKEESPAKNNKDKKDHKASIPEPEPPKQFLFSYIDLPVRSVSDYRSRFEQPPTFPKDASDDEKVLYNSGTNLIILFKSL